jgi:hypothetical protein
MQASVAFQAALATEGTALEASIRGGQAAAPFPMKGTQCGPRAGLGCAS